MIRTSAVALTALAVLTAPPALACTNFLVTPGASADEAAMITYAADSHELYGELYFTPARRNAPGSMLDVTEWDTGKRLGQIKQVERTFRTVGNMNEHQVVVGETTFDGRPELLNPKCGLDYGSLMYLALQRARTAREAIAVITGLAEEYGYCSSGESISVADPREVWLLEIVGKGPEEKGALWVARRVPDGFVTAHANQARIRTFPLSDRQNTLYAKDVIAYARKHGYFKGPDSAFSFADAYAPLTWKALRICEARVWSFFRRVAPSQDRWLEYIQGKPGAEPLPLWIKPDHKLSLRDMMAAMRDHFEGTPFDLTQGVGAGPFGLPYRWRPLYWKLDGVEYVNERATSTQQTGFSFISQSRARLPGPIGGRLWFGVDDTNSTVYQPIYSGIRHAPRPLAVGTADFEHFSWDSAFWVFNAVANLAYGGRYSDMLHDVQVVQAEFEGAFLAAGDEIDQAALALYRQSPELARDYLTRTCDEASERLQARWRRLFEQLLVRFLDGNVRDEHGKVTHPPYPDAWYKRIVQEQGEHFKAQKLPGEPDEPAEEPAGCKCPAAPPPAAPPPTAPPPEVQPGQPPR